MQMTVSISTLLPPRIKLVLSALPLGIVTSPNILPKEPVDVLEPLIVVCPLVFVKTFIGEENLPNVTVSSLLTSNIGTPLTSPTLNNEPVKLLVIVNNEPLLLSLIQI